MSWMTGQTIHRGGRLKSSEESPVGHRMTGRKGRSESGLIARRDEDGWTDEVVAGRSDGLDDCVWTEDD